MKMVTLASHSLIKDCLFSIKISPLLNRTVLPGSKICNDLKCPCDQKINSYFSLDFKTMLK